jgi:hypothetical protein
MDAKHHFLSHLYRWAVRYRRNRENINFSLNDIGLNTIIKAIHIKEKYREVLKCTEQFILVTGSVWEILYRSRANVCLNWKQHLTTFSTYKCSVTPHFLPQQIFYAFIYSTRVSGRICFLSVHKLTRLNTALEASNLVDLLHLTSFPFFLISSSLLNHI